MNTHSVRLAIALTAAFAPGVARAQHEAHQAGAPRPCRDGAMRAGSAGRRQSRCGDGPRGIGAAVQQPRRDASGGRPSRDRSARHPHPALTVFRGAAAADAQPGYTMPGLQQSPGVSAPAAPMRSFEDAHGRHTDDQARSCHGDDACHPHAADGSFEDADGRYTDHQARR